MRPRFGVDPEVEAGQPEDHQVRVEDEPREDQPITNRAPMRSAQRVVPGCDAGHALPAALTRSLAAFAGIGSGAGVWFLASSGRSTAKTAATTENAEIHRTGIAIAAP